MAWERMMAVAQKHQGLLERPLAPHQGLSLNMMSSSQDVMQGYKDCMQGPPTQMLAPHPPQVCVVERYYSCMIELFQCT